jgi:hypothetical protein
MTCISFSESLLQFPPISLASDAMRQSQGWPSTAHAEEAKPALDPKDWCSFKVVERRVLTHNDATGGNGRCWQLGEARPCRYASIDDQQLGAKCPPCLQHMPNPSVCPAHRHWHPLPAFRAANAGHAARLASGAQSMSLADLACCVCSACMWYTLWMSRQYLSVIHCCPLAGFMLPH